MRFFTNKRFIIFLSFLAVYVFYSIAFGATGTDISDTGSGHDTTPVLDILLQLIVVLLAAKLGGDLFERFKAPSVLGELLFGIIIGNLSLVGFDGFEPFKNNITLEILSEIGVIILLFEIGLETTVKEMMKVGLASFMVALLGVIAPFFLGWGVALIFIPDHSVYVHLFIGATLTATSVGITARVLKDIGKVNTNESKIILGAAVIDDILGLIILAIVTGIISAAASGSGDGISSGMVLWIIAKAVIFVLGAIIIGGYLFPRFFKFGFKMKVQGVLLSFSLLVCFLLAYLAGEAGLAPIVGAFSAGLIMEEVYYKDFTDRGEHQLEELIKPIGIFLIPIFFVRMGMMVDLTTFADTKILGFAFVLTVAAIIGKQVCSLAIFDKNINRFAIGLGMIPRGEVGLIFASIGAKLMYDGEPVIVASTYSAVVIMVILTTVVTPPVLMMSMLRGEKKHPSTKTDG